MKRALVTGGAGFIGSNLAIELEKRGWRVVVLDDFSTGHFENLRGFKGDVLAADIALPGEWAAKVGRVDAVFHQAALTDTTISDQKHMMRVNVEGWRSVLEFARGAGAKSVVYASSAGVYGSGPCPMRESQEPAPLNIYAFSKRVMERVAADFAQANKKMRIVGLRYFNVYGPRESHKGKAASMIWQLHAQMSAGRRPRVFKFGEQYRDFIHVQDVVEANLSAADARKGGVYNACTGKPTDFNAIIALLNETLGADHAPDYFDNPYGFYQSQTLGDPAAAREGLGFSARLSTREGIREYLGGRRQVAAARA